ncbi:MAG TPA: 3'-5' exonuclease, partial [Alphaproteobacteria bacterium]|nr:3'-5' exonuclease [Alphaproteobacteria bacterium]
LHATKGLEFDVVFLPGWEEGLFPHQRALDESGIAGLEEERRLAYVGLTRARRRAYVSYAANRRIHGLWQSSLPSTFVGELPRDHVELEAEAVNANAGGRFVDSPSLFRFEQARKQAPSGFGGRGMTIEGSATVVNRARPARPYGAGDRVFHDKFGYGTVKAVENDKLEIDFDHTGIKKVMDSFVKPASAV